MLNGAADCALGGLRAHRRALHNTLVYPHLGGCVSIRSTKARLHPACIHASRLLECGRQPRNLENRKHTCEVRNLEKPPARGRVLPPHAVAGHVSATLLRPRYYYRSTTALHAVHLILDRAWVCAACLVLPPPLQAVILMGWRIVIGQTSNAKESAVVI